MKKLSFLLLALFVAVIAPQMTYAQDGNKKTKAEKAEKQKVLKDGDQCVDFSYNDINGKAVTLADLKGKYVLIDIWATWCGPCVKEIPFLKKLEEKMHGKNIVFLSISIDKEKELWENMVKDEKLGGIQLHNDGNRSFMDAFGLKTIPRFILLDNEGKVVRANMIRPSSEEEIYNFLMGLKGI